MTTATSIRYGRPLEVSEIKATNNGWLVEGYASTFGNVDHGGDRVAPGAFADSIAAWETGAAKIRFLNAHQTDQVLGVFTSLHEDQKGLFVRGKISKTALGTDVHTLLVDGAVDSFSIGYIPRDFEFDDAGVRVLKAVDLLEISVVAIPMNDAATVTGVKHGGPREHWRRPMRRKLLERDLVQPVNEAEWRIVRMAHMRRRLRAIYGISV